MSKRNRERRERNKAQQDPDLHLKRLRAGECLHCGKPRDLDGVWCSACTRAGHVRMQTRHLPNPRRGEWFNDRRFVWDREAMLAQIEEWERGS